MENKKQVRYQLHPKDEANLFSRIFFCWQLPAFWKSLRNNLRDEDFCIPVKECEIETLENKLLKSWEDELNFQKYPSLWRVLLKTFAFEFFLYTFLHSISVVMLIVCQPILLKKLLDYYSQKQAIPDTEAYMYTTAFVLITIFYIITINWEIFQECVLGLKIRTACSSLIYKKIFKLSKSSDYSTSASQTLNLLSNDVKRFDYGLVHPPFMFWITPCETTAVVLLLLAYHNYIALVGIVVLIVCAVFIIYIGSKISYFRKDIARYSDTRIRLIDGILNGIQVIKMYTWEKPFTKFVQDVRNLELKTMTKISHFRIFMISVKTLIHRLLMCFYLVLSIAFGNTITIQEIFMILIIYEALKLSIVGVTPVAVVDTTEINITIKRIEKFLLCDYYTTQNKSKVILLNLTFKSPGDIEKEAVGINARNVTVKWNSTSENNLENISFTVGPKELVAFIGPAGSGKSTLLYTILQEIAPIRGTIDINGNVSYFSQETWIFSGSIKQNILFGQNFVEERYYTVIKVCSLERDLSLLPYGDSTIVGERGTMLSGGQKARISLARAIYRDADIYLLDDPLSAVDNNVGKKIFNDCITGFLKNKCVVLVTHQVQHLKSVEKIYVLKDGKISARDNFNQLGRQKKEDSDSVVESISFEKYRQRLESIESESNTPSIEKAYKAYLLDNKKWIIFVMVIILSIIVQLIGSCADYALIMGINSKQEQNKTSATSYFKHFFTDNIYMYIYGSLIILLLFSTTIRSWLFVKLCVKASKDLHKKILTNMIHATMRFFNIHDSGKILNRFSRDIGLVDENIPFVMMEVIYASFTALAIMILISVLNFWFVVPMVVLIIIFFMYGVAFIPIARCLNKLEGSARNSLFSHLTATIQGITTIRAFKTEDILIRGFNKHHDFHSSIFYTCHAFYAALRFWVDVLCTAYMAVIIFSFFYFKGSIAHIGLCIMQSTIIKGMSSFLMKNLCELDNNMASIQRILKYDKITPESDNEITTKPPLSWPNQRIIEFQSVSMRYSAKDPLVLKEVCFIVEGQEKIGIIGRTGAGKSSIISALYRLFPFDGKILIDGLDITNVPLHVLRSKISIVPQAPIFFSATLRKNLDPVDEFDDAEIWKALEAVELKEMVHNLPSGLQTLVLDGGSNFSVGQKQLFCLVRTMLRSNKIIVLDEATASIDLKTDRLIQSIIRKRFKECTILTIAHRLYTVMDADKILVMDSGYAVEFDSPYILLQNSNGHFYNYVHQSSKEILKELIRIAETNYQIKHQK